MFVASDNLRNLADRLADRFDGRSVHEPTEGVRCDRLVLLTDGQDAGSLRAVCESIERRTTRALCIGVDPRVVAWAFPGAACVKIHDEGRGLLWAQVEAAVDGDELTSPVRRPRVFLSHAVKDEAALFPVVHALREQFGVSLFVCADSIPSGSAWHEEIRRELVGCDLFLFVNSKVARQSPYCAFEAGLAVALEKRIHIVGLDDTPPPSYLQHLHAIDTLRLRERKPWLTHPDAVLEAFLMVLAPVEPVA